MLSRANKTPVQSTGKNANRALALQLSGYTASEMTKEHKGLGGSVFGFVLFLMEDAKEAFAMRGRSQKAGKEWKRTI